MLTHNQLKELIHYNPDTGIITWRERGREWFKSDRQFKNWNARYPGKQAGSSDFTKGYMKIRINFKMYRYHRLVWFYMTGKLPSKQIDHINGVRDDNRWCNLREVDEQGNARNQKMRTDNTSGQTGVSWHKSTSKWLSYIYIEGLRVDLGLFDSYGEAVRIRKEAEFNNSFHINHGRTHNK